MENRSAQGPRDTPNLYRAEVVDNEDPDRYGRVKLKIHGVTDQGAGKDTTVWAEVMQGTTPGLDKMIGVSSVLQVGTMVWCVLENNDPNKPVVVGVLIGKNDMSDALAGDKYINAQSLYTKCGHKIVIDDSEGDEFIYVYHTTGTYIKIDHNGDIWVNGVRDCQFDIARDVTWNIGRHLNVNVEGNETVNIKGTSTWTVDGDRTCNFNANETNTTQGDRTETIQGNDAETVQGTDSITVTGDRTATYNANETNTVGSNQSTTIGGSRTESVGSSKSDTIGSSWTMSAGGTTSFTTPTFSVDAPTSTFSGNVNIGGNETVGGTGTAASDYIGGGISLKGHVHGGVMGGPSMTSGPV